MLLLGFLFIPTVNCSTSRDDNSNIFSFFIFLHSRIDMFTIFICYHFFVTWASLTLFLLSILSWHEICLTIYVITFLVSKTLRTPTFFGLNSTFLICSVLYYIFLSCKTIDLVLGISTTMFSNIHAMDSSSTQVSVVHLEDKSTSSRQETCPQDPHKMHSFSLSLSFAKPS